MSLNESKAKGQLLNKGVDIFAVTEKKVNVNDAASGGAGDSSNGLKNVQTVDDKSKSTTTTSTSTNSDQTKEKSKQAADSISKKTGSN